MLAKKSLKADLSCFVMVTRAMLIIIETYNLQDFNYPLSFQFLIHQGAVKWEQFVRFSV